MKKQKIILDLCGGSGSWSRPYKEAGYDVRLITLPDYDVRTYTPPDHVYGILAAPPCTEFSVLNCKAEARPRNPDAGLSIVTACLRIIAMCQPKWWALENPAGHLREHMHTPTITFQPWEYGDPWTKRTMIWGQFNPPQKSTATGKMSLTNCRCIHVPGGENRTLPTCTNQRNP